MPLIINHTVLFKCGSNILLIIKLAIVKIKPVRPLAIETFKEFPEIGRFALRDMGTTIAAGVVKAIVEKYDPTKK